MTLSKLQALEADHLLPTYDRAPVEFVRGKGARLWDDKGNEYLDFLCGISVTSVGHCHPEVLRAVNEQLGRLDFVGNLFYTEPGIRLAARLSERSLGGTVFFSNSGGEAVEAAIKLARRARPGFEIVVVEGAFHGRTYGALSATPQQSKQLPFAPLVEGFVVTPKDPDALRAKVSESTAAVLLEPVQGETGVWPLADELLVAAREACDETGAALVFDEIQCGMGRTGTLWAYEQTSVVPDAMTLAKALGGGLPIGALVTGPLLADGFQPGDHGSTFAGGPVVAAAALAALGVIDQPLRHSSVRELGARLRAGLESMPGVREVRGRGLMVAADVDDAPEVARRALLEQRLVINATGPGTVRFLPPLTIGEAEVDAALERMGALLS